MAWGVIALLLGIAYGWWKPGRQDKVELLKTGFLAGLVLALVFGLLGYLAKANPLGLATGFAGTLVAVVILTLLFVAGVWIGDWIEDARARKARAA